MTVKDIGWVWIERELPTTDNLVNQTAILCVSRDTDNGKLASAFTKGALWIRGGLAENVPVLQPGQYVDPRAQGLMTGVGAAMSPKAEKKQHVSGPGMYKQAAVLTRS